jgi:diaminopimelate decarboxylase
MIAKAGELENAGFRLEFLDFGGGFGPRYAAEQSVFPLKRYAAAICSRIRRAGLRSAAIAVEPGKSLVADAGALLLRVEYVKESYGNIFACVNGGTFNTLPRSAIYAHPHHEIVNAGPSGEEPLARYSPVAYIHGRVRQKRPLRQSPGPPPPSETIGLSTGNPVVAYNSAVADGLAVADRKIIRVTVAGHICETGDVFGRDVRIRRPEAGDILAVLGAGAYGRSMASNFNLRPIPAEILV